MSKNTSASILAAANDRDLTERMVALASEAGVEYADGFVQQNRHRLAAAQVDENGDTVASVYEYAVLTYKPTPTPGANLSAVTDDHLRAAIAALRPADGGTA